MSWLEQWLLRKVDAVQCIYDYCNITIIFNYCTVRPARDSIDTIGYVNCEGISGYCIVLGNFSNKLSKLWSNIVWLCVERLESQVTYILIDELVGKDQCWIVVYGKKVIWWRLRKWGWNGERASLVMKEINIELKWNDNVIKQVSISFKSIFIEFVVVSMCGVTV